jgi:hypothetical protein
MPFNEVYINSQAVSVTWDDWDGEHYTGRFRIDQRRLPQGLTPERGMPVEGTPSFRPLAVAEVERQGEYLLISIDGKPLRFD